MLWWSIQIAAVSLILIFLVHHLFHFFKSTLTVPKVKDLVNGDKEEYENINKILESSVNDDMIDVSISFLPPSESFSDSKEDMKNELKNFLRKQMRNQEVVAQNEIMTSTSLSSLP